MRRSLKAILLLLAALAVGLAAGAAVALALGKSPVLFFKAYGAGAFGGAAQVSMTLKRAAPLVLAGLAVVVALKGGLFNIGVEGQMMVACVASAWMASKGPLPGPLHLALVTLAGTLAGALWALGPALLRVGRNVHEVVTTMMLNFIAAHLALYLTNGPLAGFPDGRMHAARATALPFVLVGHGGWTISSALVAAIVMCLLSAVFFARFVTGFRIRAVGLNDEACRRCGISPKRMRLSAMLLSGAVAGLAGAVLVTTVAPGGFHPSYADSTGYDAIVIAFLAGGGSAAVFPAGAFFASLGTAATDFQDAGFTGRVVFILEALILFAVAAAWALRSRRRSRTGNAS